MDQAVARMARYVVSDPHWTRGLTPPSGVVCRLRRIQSSRYEIGLQMQGVAAVETTYTSLVRVLRSPS